MDGMNVRIKSVVFFIAILSAAAASASAFGQQTGHSIEYQVDQADVVHLRQRKEKSYRLDSGDVLGIFVEGVLGDLNSSPPVLYPVAGSDLPPSVGYPIVVREGGQISLPLIKPIEVRGLTIMQAEAKIKTAYQRADSDENPILKDGTRILVSLQRKRTISVTVIRQDNSSSYFQPGNTNRGSVTDRSDRSARGQTLQLAAGDQDLFNALIASGGLPGLNAKKGIRVSRAAEPAANQYKAPTQGPKNESLSGGTPFPRSSEQRSSTGGQGFRLSKSDSYHAKSNVYRARGGIQQLEVGDVVVVEAKPTEVFYTGGMLGGGEFAIPRDQPLDVLSAIAVAGGAVGAARSTARVTGIAAFPPSELIVLRNSPIYGRYNFCVDINQAIANPAMRAQVLPGDTLILRHSPAERVRNIGVRAFNAYGIYQLLN